MSEYRQSDFSCFRECRRKFDLSVNQKLEKVYLPVEALTKVPVSWIGTAVHAGITSHYLGDRDPIEATLASLAEKEVADRPEAALAVGSVQRFIAWRAQTQFDKGWKVKLVEERLSMPLGEHIVTGAPDMIFEDKYGNYLVYDWKSVVSFTQLTSAPMNTQLLTYALLVQHNLGRYPISGSLLLIHRRPPKNNPIPCDIHTYMFTEEMLLNHRKNLELQLIDMVELTSETAYPSPSPDCVWKCQYRYVCPLMSSNSKHADFILKTEFKQREEDA